MQDKKQELKSLSSRLYGLYGISDTTLTPSKTITKQLQKAIDGGLKIFQYRDKHSKDGDIALLVGELQAMCEANGVLFILNDRYELAIKLGLSGLHLGKDEVLEFEQIRKTFKGVIGVSCYDSVNLGETFQNAGADYVAFGSIFASKTKVDATSCEKSVLDIAKKRLKIPTCAIGGICASNIAWLNCDMVAVVSSLWTPFELDSKDFNFITSNAKNLISAWSSHRS